MIYSVLFMAHVLLFCRFVCTVTIEIKIINKIRVLFSSAGIFSFIFGLSSINNYVIELQMFFKKLGKFLKAPVYTKTYSVEIIDIEFLYMTLFNII